MEKIRVNIEIINASIIDIKVDAIVNAANSTLLGGGGVDGVIHRSAGFKLLEECKKLGGCRTGQAKITKSYGITSTNYIIHTVAPKWYDSRVINKEDLLKQCYQNSLKLAERYNIKSIAFPNLGMGVYSAPIDIGTKIAIDTVLSYFKKSNDSNIEKVIFVCYESDIYNSYIKYYKDITKTNENR